MLKTEKSGQFAFFSINPGKQRGGHFHNTKNEKFILINGIVELELKNILFLKGSLAPLFF